MYIPRVWPSRASATGSAPHPSHMIVRPGPAHVSARALVAPFHDARTQLEYLNATFAPEDR